MEEKYKMLQDYLFDNGINGRSFVSEGDGKLYSVIGLENYDTDGPGKMMMKVKYRNNRTGLLDLNSHSKDKEVAIRLEKGKFYFPEFGPDCEVLFYDGHNLRSSENTGSVVASKYFYLLQDPADYARKLRESSLAQEMAASFIESKLEFILNESTFDEGLFKLDSADEVGLSPDNGPSSALRGYDTASLNAEEDLFKLDETSAEMSDSYIGPAVSDPSDTSVPYDLASDTQLKEDPKLDSFGSGSGLLDLSLQADDNSAGGIFEEIYTDPSASDNNPEESLEDIGGDTKNDSFGSARGTLSVRSDSLNEAAGESYASGYKKTRLAQDTYIRKYDRRPSFFGSKQQPKKSLFGSFMDWLRA